MSWASSNDAEQTGWSIAAEEKKYVNSICLMFDNSLSGLVGDEKEYGASNALMYTVRTPPQPALDLKLLVIKKSGFYGRISILNSRIKL